MTAHAPKAPLGGLVPVSRRVMNLATFVSQAAARLPDEPALIVDEQVITWRTLESRVAALAAVFAQAGLGRGDRILTHSPNGVEQIEVMLATFRLGAVWVPTNFRITPDEVDHLARSAGVAAFICHAGYPEHAALASTLDGLRLVAGLGPQAGPDGIGARIDAALAAGQARATQAVEYDDPCWFFFTSGTTGKPKAAVLTHGQMAFVLTNHLADLMPGTTHRDRSLVVAPLSHGAGIHYLTQVARGAATVFGTQARFSPEAAWATIERHRISNFFTVPTILKMMVEHESVDRYAHDSLRHVIYAGAPMYRADQKRALEKLGPVLVQYFGLGEVTGNITVLPPEEHSADDALMPHAGSCGRPRTGMEISIQDADGRHLPAGEQGEICVSGPAVFAGYYNNPEANRKSFRDGWFRTGDIGYLDAQGYLTITGRESDMYISGGSNIYPREIEEKILAAGWVQEICILGMPDPVWGEIGVMVAVLEEGATWDADAFQHWLDAHIARYKQPRHCVIWPELPKSGYGKITKKIVREALVERGLFPAA
ncbi:acyl-CoA synthetase [Castellaniella sp.]|uniref:acyl-CoA synthetase n=1 Tax=Castellaniella sp. TaxID=1955812 RepID=UPI00355F7695